MDRDARRKFRKLKPLKETNLGSAQALNPKSTISKSDSQVINFNYDEDYEIEDFLSAPLSSSETPAR